MPAPGPSQEQLENTFNSWSGYEGSLFANASYDPEDRDADDVSLNLTNF